MPFVKESVKERIKELRANDQEFDQAYEVAKQERRAIAKIIQARKKIGLTQKDIASKLGMKQQAISTFERISDSPSFKRFLQYANVLDLEVKIVKKRKFPKKIAVTHAFRGRSISIKRSSGELHHITDKG